MILMLVNSCLSEVVKFQLYTADSLSVQELHW